MTLRDSIKADATTVFLQTDEFAETVEYRPRNGGKRSIIALVDREPPSFWDAAGNVVTPTIVIHVANSCTKGISAKEVDTGGDSVVVSVRQNGVPPATLSIMQLTYQDDGILKLALR